MQFKFLMRNLAEVEGQVTFVNPESDRQLVALSCRCSSLHPFYAGNDIRHPVHQQ